MEAELSGSWTGFLKKIGVRDNPNCSFRNEEQKKLPHLFWSCSKVVSFWHELTIRLTLLHITPEHCTIVDPLVALGSKLDSSKNHQQIKFSCLLARDYEQMQKANAESALPRKQEFLSALF